MGKTVLVVVRRPSSAPDLGSPQEQSLGKRHPLDAAVGLAVQRERVEPATHQTRSM